MRCARRGSSLGVRPVYKRIDSCAAEFDAATPYLYSTYEAPLFGEAEDEARGFSDKRKIIILGGGPNRIGQGIEFDYCCCHAAFALGRDGAGYEVIMVNCNPETVSTDPDTSDRLYFEPLTAEDVLEIIHRESEKGELVGVIVQLGGQTPLKLAAELQAAGVHYPRHQPRFASIWPRIASGSPNWSRNWGFTSPRTASPAAATRRGRWRSGSAIRCCCARPTCLAGGRWR